MITIEQNVIHMHEQNVIHMHKQNVIHMHEQNVIHMHEQNIIHMHKQSIIHMYLNFNATLVDLVHRLSTFSKFWHSLHLIYISKIQSTWEKPVNLVPKVLFVLFNLTFKIQYYACLRKRIRHCCNFTSWWKYRGSRKNKRNCCNSWTFMPHLVYCYMGPININLDYWVERIDVFTTEVLNSWWAGIFSNVWFYCIMDFQIFCSDKNASV